MLSMGDANQLAYLRHWVPKVEGPVLEVGSREYGSTASFRGFYAGAEYVGLDMAEGEGVDVVVDLRRTIEPLAQGHFALAICCSVLEHVDRPWTFTENLTRLVRPGGLLYMSVPWAWRYHAYPDDYFRFSHRGVIALFGDFEWRAMYYSTTVPGEFVAIEPPAGEPHPDDQMTMRTRREDGNSRSYLPCLMVNMLGTRRS